MLLTQEKKIFKHNVLACIHPIDMAWVLAILMEKGLKVISLVDFLKRCHPNGVELKYIVFVTHISIKLSNTQALKTTELNNFNI